MFLNESGTMSVSSNKTSTSTYSLFVDDCIEFDYYFDNRKWCYIKFRSSDDSSDNFISFRILKCFLSCDIWNPSRAFKDPTRYDYDPFHPVRPHAFSTFVKTTTSTTPLPPRIDDGYNTDEILRTIAFKCLLPIVMFLIVVCFVLGVVLIVKSYMLTPLKQNLAAAIRRRRRTGYAPENHYIPPAEMRASARLSTSSDRKSLPPPEVLIAARARASQLLTV